jgi:hypothetical protein
VGDVPEGGPDRCDIAERWLSGDYDGVIAMCRQAETYTPDGIAEGAWQAHLAQRRGWAHWRLGDMQAAEEALRESVEHARRSAIADRIANALSHLACLLGLLGRGPEAAALELEAADTAEDEEDRERYHRFAQHHLGSE